jgi:hypothetical protein
MSMSIEDNAQRGVGEASPAVSATPPKSDAEAALQQQATPPVDEAKAAADKAEADKKAAEEEGRKKNRTKSYIERLNSDNADLRRRLAELESRSQPQAQPQQRTQPHQPQADSGPTLADCNYNLEAFQHARDQWVIQQAEKGWTEKQQKQAAQEREQATWTTYETKAAEFADAHPDFLEVVGSIAYPLTDAAQAAIAAHPNGPDIAYHLGNNDVDAFELARTPPHLAEAAVRMLAARLGAAPPPVIPAAQAPTQPRPISKAPPPAPTVSGRAPTEVPAEKLTDDDWYAKDRERRRKR